jgi:acyl-coenzyme A synthetase/AMP-(fatty) acid ligase
MTAYGRSSGSTDMIKGGSRCRRRSRSVLVAHPDVLEAAVVSAQRAGLEAVAFVVPLDTPSIKLHRRSCRKRVASFSRPRQLFVVDELPNRDRQDTALRTAEAQGKRTQDRHELTR